MVNHQVEDTTITMNLSYVPLIEIPNSDNYPHYQSGDCMNTGIKFAALLGMICIALSLVCGNAIGDVNQSQKVQSSHPSFDSPEKPDLPGDLDHKGSREMKSLNGTPDDRRTPPDGVNNSEFRERFIADLQERGIDTTDLQAAFESGDAGKIQAVMNGLREKYPMRPGNETMGGGPDGRNGREEMDRIESGREKTPAASTQPEPSPTQSPISPFLIFMSIVSGGVIAGVYLRR